MSGMDPMVEFYVHENMQLLEQLEEILLGGQSDDGGLESEQIEEIFRVMHTIKGASAMMGYDSLMHITHSIEDVFDEIRKGLELSYDKWEEVIDVTLAIVDFLKEEINNVQDGLFPEASIDELHERVIQILKEEEPEEPVLEINFPEESKEENIVKLEKVDGQTQYHAKVLFENGCGMESIRALGLVVSIEGLCSKLKTIPEDLNTDCDQEIVDNGFDLYISTEKERSEIEKCIEETMFLQSYDLVEIKDEEQSKVNIKAEQKVEELVMEGALAEAAITSEDVHEQATEKVEDVKENREVTNDEIDKINEALKKEKVNEIVEEAKPTEPAKKEAKPQNNQSHSNKNSYLTVNINKVDMLMNLVGEIVTTESMVEKQSQLENFDRDMFEKQARRLHQLTTELQDVVMSIRMVPISSTFTKMQRVVRDMCKKTGKHVDLVLVGEQTEVDKTILENISDPLMHMIRNSMDHGIEMPEDRIAKSKPEKGTITLEAKNTGGDVVIVIKDDGKGLNKEVLAKKAIEKGITNKSLDEISDKEAYNFILAPGFSTKEAVTEFSGRGVGMDVVHTNIRKLRGSINIDSEEGKGTMIIIRIPLTLAIVDGMKVQIGDEIYIIPSLNIKEVFRQGSYEIVQNPNGEEHSIIRGNCYEIRRLSNILGIESENSDEGIMILVESEMGNVCIIVDRIIGQQHVVIKPIPTLLTQFENVQSHMSGCSILEDGSISLIFDVNAIISR
ncbi:chemotaxis protein CheA [Romboutsia lituseburensis]|uniref:Chemotaxis protein CheA n=1 Tax=Romboutsia lituseburensis DSM 797 TaxID=1121325 RepID=A0A1G9PC15_9FIRM|nr:chemotaxis protein CheA [Romboutsia lituseburensis]CEH33327.1 Chemotaxis protein CheA [Romboutsia lituseburensis]SDL96412.1 two-component system, chemotaxis family, sensor kinase CheA [Romboutsia lituseburensis DSM 797]